ncbi:PD-(D/E)XK nuclease family protein, partial [Anaerostipes caccae]|uniref:PD-(D/E)XK nuclease family protein n=1 Tax=Anaerostipes caccae TaxID=105841 RepID=UPI00210C1E44
EFKNLGRKVEEKMKQLGEAMMDGDISISPYKYQSMPCDYCAFKSICAYEPKLMKSRKLEKIGLAEAKELLAERKGEDDALD